MRILLPLLFLLVACSGPQAPLVATSVEVTRPLPGRAMSAGYLVLTNNTAAELRITRIASPQFGVVEIHETTLEDGIARMREVPVLIVPAQGSVVLERGGKHLMLMRAQDLGTSVTLQFFSDDTPVLSLTHTFDAG